MAWGTGSFVKPNAYERQRQSSLSGIAKAMSTGGTPVQPTVPTVPVTEGNPTLSTVNPYALPPGTPSGTASNATVTPTPTSTAPPPTTTVPPPPAVTPTVNNGSYGLFPTAPRSPTTGTAPTGAAPSGFSLQPPAPTPTATTWTPGQAMPYSPATGYASNPMYANAMNTPHAPLAAGQPTPAGGWDPITQQPIWSSQQLADMAGPAWQSYMAKLKG